MEHGNSYYGRDYNTHSKKENKKKKKCQYICLNLICLHLIDILSNCFLSLICCMQVDILSLVFVQGILISLIHVLHLSPVATSRFFSIILYISLVCAMSFVAIASC